MKKIILERIMKYKITCESSADLNQDMYKKLKVPVIPFCISLGEKNYSDGVDIKSEDLFKYFEDTKQLPKTSAINEYAYEEFFKEQLKDCEGLIHFCISSDISSAYNNAINASKKFENVHIIDSRSLSSGIGLQVMYATTLRDKGMDINQAVALINSRKEHVQISFVIDKLNYLHKGGRCSALALLGANALSLRPSIQVKNGKMNVAKKYMGKMPKILDKYILDTLEQFNNPDKSLCFITYSSATPEMLDIAHKTLEKTGIFKKIVETTAGSTVATHCGPNTLGIIYYNDGGENTDK